MTEQQRLSSKINDGVKAAISQALERHRKLGEAIAIWQDEQVIVVPADQIPLMQSEQGSENASRGSMNLESNL